MKVGKKGWVVIFVLLGLSVLSLPILIPLVGFQYRFWQMHQVLDHVSEEELINRTKDLPQVKEFIAKYPNYDVYVDADYHIAVRYFITECAYNGKHCDVAQPDFAELPIYFDLSTGYPRENQDID